MSETVSFSPTLILTGPASARRIACRACGCDLAPASGVWKEHAVLDEQLLSEAGGETFRSDSTVLLRRFYCPSCGTTLDAETALPGEPFLIDRVRGLEVAKKMLRHAQDEPAEAGGTLGHRLRLLRHGRGFSIAELARLSGVPGSTISKIENGLLNPSLVHAINLASALEANLGFLADSARTRHARYGVVRKTQRGRREFPEMSMVLEDLNIGFVPGLLESRIGTISPAGHSGAERMTHPGEELVHVLSGTVTYDLDGVEYRLAEGETLHFKCDTPHRWVNHGGRDAVLLWVFSDGLSF